MENLERILDAMEQKSLAKEEFHLRKIDQYQYRLTPTISLGTPQTSVNGMLANPDEIKVLMNLLPKDNNLQEIEMMGSIHKFHLILFILGLFCFVLSVNALLTHEQFAPVILTILLWPVFHIWFNFVWTSQEKALIEEVKLALHIRIRARVGLKS